MRPPKNEDPFKIAKHRADWVNQLKASIKTNSEEIERELKKEPSKESSYKDMLERSKVRSVSDDIKFNTVISYCRISCMIVLIVVMLSTFVGFYIVGVIQFFGNGADLPYNVSWVVPHTLTAVISLFIGWSMKEIFSKV